MSGRVLSVRFGYNPNSSSLGVDVTFLLFGMGAITLLTPVVAALLRLNRSPAPVRDGQSGSTSVPSEESTPWKR